MITIMIKRAERENIDEIKRLWKVCFPDVDERYQDFFFKNVVRPGDRLDMESKLLMVKGPILKAEVQAFVEGKLTVKAELMFSVIDQTKVV